MTIPQQPPFGPPVPPKKGMSTGRKIGLGCGGCLGFLLVLFMFAGCMAALSGDTSPAQEGSAETRQEATEPEEDITENEEEQVEEEPEEEEEPEPEPEGPAAIGNGVHRVGDDIEPGTYSTDGPDPDGILPMCYYARLSGLSGEFDDIITNNNIEGPGTVVVADGDAALELSGGCEWTLQ